MSNILSAADQVSSTDSPAAVRTGAVVGATGPGVPAPGPVIQHEPLYGTRSASGLVHVITPGDAELARSAARFSNEQATDFVECVEAVKSVDGGVTWASLPLVEHIDVIADPVPPAPSVTQSLHPDDDQNHEHVPAFVGTWSTPLTVGSEQIVMALATCRRCERQIVAVERRTTVTDDLDLVGATLLGRSVWSVYQ